MPSGKGDESGQPGSLGSDGVFSHLDQQVLAFLEKVLNGIGRRGPRTLVNFDLKVFPFLQIFLYLLRKE